MSRKPSKHDIERIIERLGTAKRDAMGALDQAEKELDFLGAHTLNNILKVCAELESLQNIITSKKGELK